MRAPADLLRAGRARVATCARRWIALTALWLAASCSGHSIEQAAGQFTEVSVDLERNILLLRKEVEALRENWDPAEIRSQADVHWERLKNAIREESLAEEAYRRREISAAEALQRMRGEISKVVMSNATVKQILARVDLLRIRSQAVAARLRDVDERSLRVRGVLFGAADLKPEDRELYQATFDLANRRLSEMHSLLRDGLAWFLQDARKATAIVDSGLVELSNLDVTFQRLEKDLIK